MMRRTTLSVIAVILVTACHSDEGQESRAAGPASGKSVSQAEAEHPPATEQGPDVMASELAGSAWQLVEIQSMDDSVYAPEDGSRYTLIFGSDGQASIQADCNRGSGGWTSGQAGQVEFGAIASTMALCPPGSLSEKYLAQFEWVRSYVLKNGHLFFSTMADGSIIEFAPLPPLAATVLGEEIRSADADEMQSRVLQRLLDAYASGQGITVSEAELDEYVTNLERGMAAEGLAAADDLTPEEAAEVNAMRRDMGRALILQWKINKALYEQYGGRIIYQQFGPEPLDAYRTYLEERQSAGDFTIENPDMQESFWRYFTDDSMHDFMPVGSEDETRAFAEPPWN